MNPRETPSSFVIRWCTAADSSKPAGDRVFAAAELVCLPLSFLTFAWLLADIVLRRGFGVTLVRGGSVFGDIVLPILAAAAIGYVTNWLAIKMLFEPHEPTWRHWIPWITFGFWRQGLLPKNKARMARELGQTFGARLLRPERLVAELSDKAEAYLARPDVAETFKSEAQSLLRDNADAIAAFLVPEIERAAGTLLDRFLAPEKLGTFWDETLAPRLNDGATRALIAEKIIDVVRRNAPAFSRTIQRELREHLRRKFGGAGGYLGSLGDAAADFVMDYFADDEAIRRKVADWLRKPETTQLLKGQLILLGEKATEWMHSEEGRAAMGGFAAEIKSKAGEALSEYVKEALPKLVGDALDSPRLWTWVETSALPALRRRLTDYIAANGDRILETFDLPGRIEKEVNALDMASFHALLDRLMAQHLGAIQVLGYVLGAVVGALQCL